MNSHFNTCVSSLTRFIYFVTEEEDRFLVQLSESLKAAARERVSVYSPTSGILALADVLQDWKTGAHRVNDKTMNIHDALVDVYKANPSQKAPHIWVFKDPHVWLRDAMVQRRFLNIAHRLNNNPASAKIIVLLGRLALPPSIQRYVEVVRDHGLTEDEISSYVGRLCKEAGIELPEAEVIQNMKGLTSFEINTVFDRGLRASFEMGRTDPTKAMCIPLETVVQFKQRQIDKTDLLTMIDVADSSADSLGGADNFKTWVTKHKACWTTEGQKFGLKPPKGVLLVGVWGCGKSLGAKVLANTWGMPLVNLDMGKLRSSGVGETEANVARATALIESVAPCIVLVDEAEKAFSGSHSSSHSDAGTTSRVLGSFSTWLQETKAPVCVVMTANSLKTLPVEFVNRMSERFFFDLPTPEERIAIIKIHLRKNHQDPAAMDGEEPRYNLVELAEASKTMVGREIQYSIEAAMVESFTQGKPFLDQQILLAEMKSKPRIFKTMVDEMREVLDWVGYDEDAKEGIRAKLASSHRTKP